MQDVAREMNLSETAFILKEDDAYSLRWFTPETEVDLCGHATLASAHILWEKRFVKGNEIRFNTKSGLLTAIKKEDWIELNFPLEIEEECVFPDELKDGLGVDFIYTGKNRLDYIVEIDSEEALKHLKPNFNLLENVKSRGIIVTSQSKQTGIDFVSRCFYPALGINEDPVTGSAHCCLGPYWQQKLKKNKMTARQLSSRGGLLKLTVLKERILITGQAVTTLQGQLCGE